MKLDIRIYEWKIWRRIFHFLLLRSTVFTIYMTCLTIRGVLSTCDTKSLQDCVHQLSETERLLASGALRYREYELDEACRRFDDIGVCVRRATRSCRSEESLKVIEKYWAGVKASFTYMCKEGKAVYLKHQKCYAQNNLEYPLRKCNKTYEQDREDLNQIAHNTRHVDVHKQHCRIANSLLACLKTQLTDQCGEEAAQWQINAARKLREPNMILYHGCRLDAARATFGLVFIALASAVTATNIAPFCCT